jgi:hypothetical protein
MSAMYENTYTHYSDPGDDPDYQPAPPEIEIAPAPAVVDRTPRKVFTVYVKTGVTSWWNLSGLYHIEIGKHELEVGQTCIERINDLVDGQWTIDFDDGELIACAEIQRGRAANTCRDCGKRIPHIRTWCNDCLFKIAKG